MRKSLKTLSVVPLALAAVTVTALISAPARAEREKVRVSESASSEQFHQVTIAVAPNPGATVVPEPATYALMASGLLPLGAALIRRRKS